MKKTLILSAFAFVLVTLGFFAYSNFSMTSDNSPFPVQEPTAQYMIRKEGNSYLVNYKRGSDDLQAYVGSSPSDLDQFVDKQVKLTGSYIEAKPYCTGECIGNSSQKQTVFKIETINLAE